jgi:tRNA pseudouridine32 synthase/23S rRNA pseudouridine746 synthase
MHPGLLFGEGLKSEARTVQAPLRSVNPLMLLRVVPAAWTLLHADEAIVVVCKPPDLLAVPGKGEAGRVNLAAMVRDSGFADALVVHRLDMATSGLMVFARGAGHQRSLSMAFEQRRVHKRYVAVVEGTPSPAEGVVEVPLAADWPARPKQMVDFELGRPSLTRYAVLGPAAEGRFSRVELEPVTGRSHQLRVHLMHIGHPIVGDAFYGGAPAARLMLHASALAFSHPARGDAMRFESAPPF